MKLLRYLIENIAIQFMDEPGLFQDGNEDIRREPSVNGIFPAGQRFDAADFPGHRPDDGLIIDFDVAFFQGRVEIFQDEIPLLQGDAHFPRINGPAPCGISLDRITGDFGHIKRMAHDMDIVVFQQADASLQDDIGIIDIPIDAAADDLDGLEQVFFLRCQYTKPIGRKMRNQGIGERLPQHRGDVFEAMVAGSYAVEGVVQAEMSQVEINRTVF